MLYDIINIQCLEYPLLTLYHTKGTYAYYFFHHWTMIIIKSMCCYCCWTRLIYVLIFSNFYIFVGNLSSRNLFFVNQYFTFLLNFVSCFLKTPLLSSIIAFPDAWHTHSSGLKENRVFCFKDPAYDHTPSKCKRTLPP